MIRLSHWLWDAFGIAGAALVFAGLWSIYPPAALIVAGAGLVAVAVWGARWVS